MTADTLFDQDNKDTKSNETQDTGGQELDLVGEGKRYKSVEELAKGKIEGDKFIAKLEDELQELREGTNTNRLRI